MENFLSGIKKLAVMLIAGVMLLGVVPVGLVSKPTTVSAEGEFLRISPSAEAFVSSKYGERGTSGRDISSDLNMVGEQYDTYLRFDISNLLDKNINEIHKAALRLAVVNTGMENTDTVQLWHMQDNVWNESVTYENRPSSVGELKLADISMAACCKTGSVVEVDLTEYVKNQIENDSSVLSLHLNAAGSGTASFAASLYEDRAFRPCLKIITGDAVDTDQSDLTKAWLENSVSTGNSKYAENALYIGNSSEIYLKFHLNRGNIQGAMYDIRLKADLLRAKDGTDISVYLVHCGDWSSINEPAESEETLVHNSALTEGTESLAVNLTDPVNDIYSAGGEFITLRIAADSDGESVFYSSGNLAPRLDIRATDSPRVVASVEAGARALGENPAPAAITSDLLENYAAADGTKAFFKWSAYDPETGKRIYDILSDDGTITRPKWFEDSRTIHAKAVIASGAYRTERSFILTVLPDDPPNYDGLQFADCTDIGSSADESAKYAEFVNAPAHSRRIDGNNLTYRTLENDGIMVLNMAVDPQRQNYLTLKLWKPESPSVSLTIASLQDNSAGALVCGYPTESSREDGFIYLTYPLPAEYTQGRAYVSLKITPAEPAAEDSAMWSIYGAYTGQSPYFDPLSYAEQGETFLAKASLTDTAFYQFLKQLYETTQQVIPILGDTADNSRTVKAPSYTWVDNSGISVLAFSSGENKTAVSVSASDGKFSVRRNALYYDSYSEAYADIANGITDIEYGPFRIIRNQSSSEISLPKNLSGVYRDLINGGYYSFIKDGEMTDDSILPQDVELKDGSCISVAPEETIILELVAEPLCCADWRVSKINGKAVAGLSINQETSINEICVKNIGKSPNDEESLKVICCVYERGYLAGMTSQSFTANSDQIEYTIELSPVAVKPGQTIKIFVESADSEPDTITPKLELP